MARPADGLRAERPDLRGRRADGGAVAASSNRRPGEERKGGILQLGGKVVSFTPGSQRAGFGRLARVLRCPAVRPGHVPRSPGPPGPHAAAPRLGSFGDLRLAQGGATVKDQLRRGFELLKAVPGACVVQRAVQMVQGLARDGLTLKTAFAAHLPPPVSTLPGPAAKAVGVCVVGQPRALLRWPEPLLSQLFQALCPLPRMRILFVLAAQPSLGLHSEAAEPLEAALQTALQHARCGERMLPAELSLDLHDDLEDEEIQGLVDAYPAEAWWHQEGFGRTKWVRQLQSLARCHQLVDGDSDGLEWMLILRPDLLHIVPVPAVSRWEPPEGGASRARRVVLAHSGRSNVSPQAGYLEGLDRAMVLGRSAADAVLRRPLEVLSNGSWVAAHPSCLSCPAWRSPGVKLGPEKHLANVLYDAEVELMLEETWIQPLVLSERGCVNFRPCEGASCKSRDALPRWARRLVLDHTCWPASDPLAAEAWVQAAEGPGEVSGPAAAFLPEIFPRSLEA
ncbi:unnamed protein product [Effrenium voratum]|uniref:Uncharacterized protein n=1 Tax=Effrenium voratum TaxID=2562239 RepID=A0AA36NGA5_9DINO|nr:unnamed protein product [Effrenium voratum]